MTAILVVESDPDIGEFLTGALQVEFAAVVRSANTGALGAEAIETGAFDLAIIDVLMPDVSGYELAERAVDKNIPALLCSENPNALAKLERHGFPHLAKPFEIAELSYKAATIITHAAENLRRVKASLAQLQLTGTGLLNAMSESERLIQESKALVARRPQSVYRGTKRDFGRDRDIPSDVIGDWLSRLARRSKGN